MAASTMSYHIAIKGTQSGPHAEETVREMIAGGTLQATDLCWREGWPQWEPVGKAFPAAGVAAPVIAGSAPLRTNTAPGQVRVAEGTFTDESNEAVRRTYLNHEASVQGIGSLYLLGAVICVLAGVVGLLGGQANPGGEQESKTVGMITGGVLLALGVLQFQVGLWLRKLDSRAKTPVTVFACLGLLAFPIGTLINGYVLYLLHSEKGKAVLSAEYQEVIASTPHIKYKTSVWIWVFLAVLVALLIAGGMAAARG